LYELVVAERDMLEKLVRQLCLGSNRPYPEVLPKYRNPNSQDETWCGRGKQPRWLTAELQTGKKLSDFLIDTRFGSE
jgi:DNA-binding protein H-NS